jgi:NADH:ubiquinone oxidoreductase subunit F (NADH-binding)
VLVLTFVVKKRFIESLKEKRNPRIKPPFPAVSGLWQPNRGNNVETIASVPWIVNNCDDYAKIGIGRYWNQINFSFRTIKTLVTKLNYWD